MPDNDDDIMSLMMAENNRLAGILVPISWSSSSQNSYVHWDEEKERDVCYTKDEYKRFLKSKGLAGTKRPSENMSEVEAYLARIDADRKVDYIGKIACLPHGFLEVNGQKFYNTLILKESDHASEHHFIQPIEDALTAFLHEQCPRVKGLLKRNIACVTIGGDWLRQVPPMTVFVGDSFEEGERFLALFGRILGGEVIDPTHYLVNPKKEAPVFLAKASHWSVKTLSKGSTKLLHNLLTFEGLSYGEVMLPCVSQRTVFVHNKAEDLKELPANLLDLANVIYLYPLGNFVCRYGNADFSYFRECLLNSDIDDVTRGGFIAPEVKQTLFGATLAGEAYQILKHNMSGESVSLDEQAILTRIENSSRHFQNRMNRERSTPGAILEAVAGQWPGQIYRISETHWRFNFPQTTNNESDNESENIGNNH